MRAGRAEWAKRVERWKDSGLTAKEFAAELGVNPRTLVYWKWQLSGVRESGGTSPSLRVEMSAPKSLPLVEVTPMVHATSFDLELSGGRRLTIPSTFDPAALRRLMAVLAETT
jgi:transposase